MILRVGRTRPSLMASSVMLLLLLLLLISLASGTRVTLVNNAYRGLVVGIDERVDVLQCRSIVSNLYRLLRAASERLYVATGRRAYLGEVSLVVPAAWPRGCTGAAPVTAATTENYLQADVRVSGRHPLHGSAPWTQQPGGCGQPGQFIQLAGEYVASADNASFGSQGAVLVHEWARYRWGVFEETGFPTDPLYPSFYELQQDQWRPTGCSNTAVTGSVHPPGCTPSSNNCTFLPRLDSSNDAVTSSIMYMQALPKMRHFCNASTHDRTAPTKHNQLCGGRSVWRVMQDHEDFKQRRNPPRAAGLTLPPTEVRVVRAAPDRLFFLLESTATMRRQERWDFVGNSLRKFVNWDVPTGVQIGLGHFGAGYSTDRNLTTVPDSRIGRGELANIPPIADDVPAERRGWRRAVDGALGALGARAPGATLVWVTGNQPSSAIRPSEADVDYIIGALQRNQVRLVLVFYPSPTPGLARAASATSGDVIRVSDVTHGHQTSISVLHALADAYRFALERHASHVSGLLVRVEDRRFRGDGQQARGSFLLDRTLGVNTTLTVLYRQRSDIGYVKLQPPGGQMETVYTYPDSTNHLQYARIDNVPGEWHYQIDNLAASHSSIYVQVTSSAASSSGDTARVRVWTNAPAAGALNVTVQPLVIYASVMQGTAPVLDADVTALVRRSDGLTVRLQLLDDGRAVPDVLHGDGTYSRYFFDYASRSGDGTSSAERSALQISVSVGGGAARVATGRPRPAASPRGRALPADGAPPCCGSTVGAVTSVPLPDLQRTARAAETLVTGTQPLRDLLPPARVGDLAAVVHPERQTVQFTWTAVGDDFDRPNTQVERYEVRYSEDRAQLLEHFSDCTSVPHWSEPRPAGTPSRASIQFSTINTLTFFAMVGVDTAGNRAPVGNVVSVVMPPAPPPPSPTPTGTTSPPQPTPEPFDNHLLLVVLLCVAGLILLLVLVAVYYYLCRRRRGKPDPDAGLRGYVNTVSVTASELSREPTPVKLPMEQTDGAETPPPQPPPLPRDYVPSSAAQRWTTPDILHTPDHGAYSTYGRRTADTYDGRALPGGGRARYNSYQTPYIEDVAYDGRSLQSTLPSGSLASLASASRPRQRHAGDAEPWCEPRPEPWSGPRPEPEPEPWDDGRPAADRYAESPYQGGSPLPGGYGDLGSQSSHLDLSGSQLPADRRRRNVTQV